MHSKDGVRIVYARPASFQTQNGGCVINCLLTEREDRTGEYWPDVVAVRTERSEVRTATTEGQYSPVRPEQARLVSGLLYGTVFLIVKCNGTLFLIIKCNFKNAL